MKVEIFEFQTGFGYRILDRENVIHYQEFDPDLPGFELMDRETAEAKANIVAERLSA